MEVCRIALCYVIAVILDYIYLQCIDDQNIDIDVDNINSVKYKK